jgi:glucose-6-phosphate isomerase
MAATPITASAEWRALSEHRDKLADTHLRSLFADEPGRGETMTVEAGDLYLDYSKNRLTAETLQLLVGLAERARLRERIEAMFRGEKVNLTEGRAVLHVALRAPRGESILVDGVDVVPEVHEVLGRMGEFCERVRDAFADVYDREPVEVEAARVEGIEAVAA